MGAKKKQSIPVVTETTIADTTPTRIPGEGLGVTIAKRDLALAIRRFTGIVDRKSTMPILANVSIQTASPGGLTITATDLNVSLRLTAPCTVERSGAVSIPHKRLADVLKTIPDGALTLYQTTKTNLVLRASTGAQVEIAGMHDRDTPRFPSLASKEKSHDFSEYETRDWPSVDGATLQGALERVLHAVCRDETRFHLNGVLFEANGRVATLVTTDGHRLAKADFDLPQLPTVDAGTPFCTGKILPRKVCVELGKVLTAKEPIGVLITKTHAWFRQGTITLVGKLIDAQFPPYEQVVPKDHRRLFTVDRDALAGAMARARVNTTDLRGAEMRLASGKLTIEASDPDSGTITETIDVEYDGDPMAMGVNAKYLIETLDQLDGRVVFAWSARKDGALDPMLVRSLDDAAMRPVMNASFLSVIMPMRI
jgi:DNA polymerase III subunit beta